MTAEDYNATKTTRKEIWSNLMGREEPATTGKGPQPKKKKVQQPIGDTDDYSYPYMGSLEDLGRKKAEILDLQKKQLEQQQARQPLMATTGAISGGLSAGLQVPASTDPTDVGLSMLAAGATGMAAGAAAGPLGAGLGGVVGLVAGGLKGYVGLRSARKESRRRERENKKTNRAIMRQNRELARQQRFREKMRTKEFGLQEQKFAASEDQRELENKWQKIKDRRDMFDHILSKNETLKNRFLRGRK